MEKLYDRLTEWMDRSVSRWWSFGVFCLTVGWVWWRFGYDYANFYISITTLAFFFLFAYGQRKDRLANQLKHDALIAVSEAQNEIQKIERKTLSEIEKTGDC